MEKSKVSVMKNRCGRKIKAKTSNGLNERRSRQRGRGKKQKSQTTYSSWRRHSVLICLMGRRGFFTPFCPPFLHFSSLFSVKASYRCSSDRLTQCPSPSPTALFCNAASVCPAALISEGGGVDPGDLYMTW